MKMESKLQEKSSVLLKLTVPAKDIKEEYDSLLSEYCKNAQIKGFRKGKVPKNVLIKKFGESIKSETVQAVISKSLEKAFKDVEYKPLPYAQPRLAEEEKMDINNVDMEKDFSFAVNYDTHPEIKLGDYKDLEIKEPVVSIGKEDMDRELKEVQERFAIVKDKNGGIIEKQDTITVDYVELDDKGEELDGAKREGFSFIVGSGYNIHKIDDDVIGMKKDEEKIFDKEYPEDFEHKNLAGKKVKLKVKINSIKEKILPEINDELAQDVDDKFKTLVELKADIKKRLKENSDFRIKEANITELLNQIRNSSEIDLPESMIERSLHIRYSEFVRQFGGNEEYILKSLKQQGKKIEDLIEEWRPSVIDGVKTSLIVEKLGKEEKVEVSDEEVDEEIKKNAEHHNKEFKELKDMYIKNKMLEALKENVKAKKIYDLLLESSSIKKGSKIKYLDLIQGKQ